MSESPIESSVERVAALGDGVVRHEGQVFYIPQAAPGDRILWRPTASGRGQQRLGELLEVISPGPSRREPPCRHAGTCGGCDWQHISEPNQNEARHRIVGNALERHGLERALVRAVEVSPRPLRYRRRARVRLRKGAWGFEQRGSHTFVPVEACALLDEACQEAVTATVQALAAQGVARRARVLSVDTLQDGTFSALLELDRPAGADVLARVSRAFTSLGRCRGALITAEAWREVVGKPILTDPEEDGLRLRADLFSQANRLGARRLVQAVTAAVEPNSEVLECFAGIGTFTRPLLVNASRFVATEVSSSALEVLRSGLPEAEGRRLRCLAGDATKVLGGLLTGGERFDVVVLDPPRAGAGDAVVEAIARLARRRIVYVSCSPMTFSRDAKRLVELGWRCEAVTPWDLFPQTHHVEVLATFSRQVPGQQEPTVEPARSRGGALGPSWS